jgi:ankyrin repeat protein
MDWPKTDNVLNREGESPLMLAALKRPPTSHKSALIKKRRGHQQNRLDGWHLRAASSGSSPSSASLLELNAYIDAESPNGTTPLMMAAMWF